VLEQANKSSGLRSELVYKALQLCSGQHVTVFYEAHNALDLLVEFCGADAGHHGHVPIGELAVIAFRFT
jgi:hypothetical protein